MKIVFKTNFTWLLFFIIVCIGCKRDRKNTPEYVAKEYISALMNKDWEKAKKYATPEINAIVDMAAKQNSNFGLTEVKDIICEKRNNGEFESATCYFCCSTDTNFRCIHLNNSANKQWKVILVKEGPCR